MKYPGKLELWMNPGHQLEEELDGPYISIISVSKVNVLGLHCNSPVVMGYSLEDLSQAGSCYGVGIKMLKQFSR